MVPRSRSLDFRNSEIPQNRIESGSENVVGRIVFRRRRRRTGDAGRHHGGYLAQHVGKLGCSQVRLFLSKTLCYHFECIEFKIFINTNLTISK